KIEAAAAAAGRSLEGFAKGHLTFVTIGKDYESAERVWVDRLSKRYAQDFGPLAKKYGIIGTPSQCAEQMERFVEAGCGYFVLDELDRSAIYAAYEQADRRGQPPYHPAMMVKLLLYGYCTGMPSSRKIEQATYRDVAFRVLAADQHPDHDSIAEFRKRHLEALAGLFVQVLQLCQGAGLVTLGRVALDGTKLKANASKHTAMSYARMEETEARL